MQKTELKYCIVAFIDLLGFSNHLEVSKDIRTNIGSEAIKRLQFLEEALQNLEKEKIKYSFLYPNNIYWTRINDALIFSMDLHEGLLPAIGETAINGLTVKEWEERFNFKETPLEKLEETYYKKVKEYTTPVELFIGLISRVHNFINKKENENHFPGVKSVISSGFRRNFISNGKEDILSANFAFSNAYVAEKDLKGSNLYIDTNILRFLTSDQYIRNILKYSCFIYEDNIFSPFNSTDEIFGLSGKFEQTETKEITLFRKKYYFRNVNPNPLTYLLLISAIMPELKKMTEPYKNPSLHQKFLNDFFRSDTENKIKEGGIHTLLQVPFTLTDNYDNFLGFFRKKN